MTVRWASLQLQSCESGFDTWSISKFGLYVVWCKADSGGRGLIWEEETNRLGLSASTKEAANIDHIDH